MQLRDTPEQAAWREEVRAFIRENLPADIRGVTGFFYDPRTNPAFGQWRDALVRRGWIAPAWPKEYGGAGMTVVEQFILNQEFAEAGAPQPGGLGVMMLGPTLITHGTE
ncbi:MAG: acyl-CoA dehydrogenase family protein, partial [Dehalococcoidia bacterium]|nr:acyl-CoA dehydrogenase family protein [Dehalococcoidia bacterium]